MNGGDQTCSYLCASFLESLTFWKNYINKKRTTVSSCGEICQLCSSPEFNFIIFIMSGPFARVINLGPNSCSVTAHLQNNRQLVNMKGTRLLISLITHCCYPLYICFIIYFYESDSYNEPDLTEPLRYVILLLFVSPPLTVAQRGK